MIRIRLCVALSLVALTACGQSSATASFGPPRTLSKDQRPTAWDATTKDRLGLGESSGRAGQDPSPQPGSVRGDTPAGWTQLAPQPSRFRHLLWQVGSDPSHECYLTLGTRGGLAGNVSRWYQQFGQQMGDPTALPEVAFFGGKGRLVELVGTFNDKPDMAMLGIVQVEGDVVTTLKFTATAEVVKQNRAQFLQVAASLRSDGAGRAGSTGATSPAASGGGAPAPGTVYVGTTPEGWEALPPQPERMRLALWRLAGDASTECYVTGPTAGGVAGNLTRWYGQFGRQDAPAAEALEIVEMLGTTGRLVELYGTFQGKPGLGMLLAFTARGDEVTTLKFTGPEAVVKQHKARFLALAKSLRTASASPDPTAPAIQRGQPMPSNHPPVPEAVKQAPPPPSGPFTGTVPSGWTAKAGSSKFLHHAFAGDGEVYLGQLGGGLKATLDIWRGELGQAAMTDQEYLALPQIAFLGEDALLLDLSGDFRSMSGKQIQGARLLVAARSEGNTIVFCKLVGAAAEVEKQVDGFRSFCASVRRVP
ncbi:MAG: hypothetical protein JNL12_16735 [Planctomycetes bacterium]|nr:hypothetical protein [Planctomycetota bacterium]